MADISGFNFNALAWLLTSSEGGKRQLKKADNS